MTKNSEGRSTLRFKVIIAAMQPKIPSFSDGTPLMRCLAEVAAGVAVRDNIASQISDDLWNWILHALKSKKLDEMQDINASVLYVLEEIKNLQAALHKKNILLAKLLNK